MTDLETIFSCFTNEIAPEGSLPMSGLAYVRFIDKDGKVSFAWREVASNHGSRDVSATVGDLQRIQFALMNDNYVTEDGRLHKEGDET